MAERESKLIGEVSDNAAGGKTVKVSMLPGSDPIGTVHFVPEKPTIMELAPRYDNWCRQVMRCAKEAVAS